MRMRLLDASKPTFAVCCVAGRRLERDPPGAGPKVDLAEKIAWAEAHQEAVARFTTLFFG